MKQAITSASKKVASITWWFIPVAIPHFGGLCEVAVKSAKLQLKHVCDKAKIVPTFAEFVPGLC